MNGAVGPLEMSIMFILGLNGIIKEKQSLEKTLQRVNFVCFSCFVKKEINIIFNTNFF